VLLDCVHRGTFGARWGWKSKEHVQIGQEAFALAFDRIRNDFGPGSNKDAKTEGELSGSPAGAEGVRA